MVRQSSDVVQVIWTEFFRRRFQLRPWESVRHLGAFLRGMTLNATRQVLRPYRDSQKRDASRETTVEEAMRTGDAALLYDAATPPNEAVALELLEQLMARLPAAYREIMAMRREGLSFRQIADVTGIGERTIRRFYAADSACLVG